MSQQQSTKAKGRPGRPEGSVVTPHSLLKQELTQTIRANKEIRDLLSAIIADVRKVISDPGTKLADKLAALAVLSKALDNSGGSISDIAKHLLADAAPEDASVEDILKGFGG
jgi:cytochrome P450